MRIGHVSRAHDPIADLGRLLQDRTLDPLGVLTSPGNGSAGEDEGNALILQQTERLNDLFEVLSRLESSEKEHVRAIDPVSPPDLLDPHGRSRSEHLDVGAVMDRAYTVSIDVMEP